MVPGISIPAGLLLLTAYASAQLNLSPRESFYEVEGIRSPNVKFRNGSNDVFYTPPVGWQLSGGGQKLALIPADKVQAGASIEAEGAKEIPAIGPGSFEAYGEMARALMPREAAKVEVVEVGISSLRISGHPMMEVTLEYTFFGQQFRRNVLFMPHDTELIRFEISARTSDYVDLKQAFHESLYSMRGL